MATLRQGHSSMFDIRSDLNGMRISWAVYALLGRGPLGQPQCMQGYVQTPISLGLSFVTSHSFGENFV